MTNEDFEFSQDGTSFHSRFSKPIGAWTWFLPMETALQGRGLLWADPFSLCSRLLVSPWIRRWLRMGGEDKIKLITQGLLMSTLGEGQEKGCLSQLPQGPGCWLLALFGPLLSDISAFYSIPLPRFQLPARTMIRDFIIFSSYMGMKSFTKGLFFRDSTFKHLSRSICTTL